jgi:hypothetical protein
MHAPQSQSAVFVHVFASQYGPAHRMLGPHDVAVHAGCAQPCSSWM